MKLNVATRIFLSLLLACALVLAVSNVVGRISFERDFLGYINEQGVQRMQQIAVRAASAYQAHGSWAFLLSDRKAWFQLLRPEWVKADEIMHELPPVSDQTGVTLRLALLDARGQRLLGNPAATAKGAVRTPVEVAGETVGWLAMVPLEQAIDPQDVRFYQAQQRAWWVNIAASIAIAALLAWMISRLQLRRLRVLTDGIYRLAAGEYTARIADQSGDELSRLADDVNRLAAVLEHAEQSRRDFMADISHELRTPLAVLRAELEAIEDGIRPLQPASLAPLQEQVQQLGKLIDDLHELSLAQAEPTYQFASIDAAAALEATLGSMTQRFSDAGLQLLPAELSQRPLLVHGEERRLRQLFANLFENALRYTDRGGQVRASARADNGQARIVIEDSAPGVPADKLARLFERFYRVEASRCRASGGSGLGLAICRFIVEAHRGTIVAEASPLGGLRIVITLPLIA